MKKAVFASVLSLGMIAVLEMVSFLALAVRDGRLPSVALWLTVRGIPFQSLTGLFGISPR